MRAYSVVVAAPDQPRQLLRTLLALRQHACPSEVLIVGPRTGAEAVMRLSQLPARLVALNESEPTTVAFNVGLDQAKHDIVLLLDRDVLLESDPIGGVELLNDQDDLGVAGAKLLTEGGSPRRVLHAGYAVGRGRVCPTTIGWGLADAEIQPEAYEVAAVSYACMLVRRCDIRFDERYGSRLADVDVCFQYRQQGYRVALLPSLHATRMAGQAGGLTWEAGLTWTARHLGGQWLYHTKWCSDRSLEQHPTQPAVRGEAARAYLRQLEARYKL